MNTFWISALKIMTSKGLSQSALAKKIDVPRYRVHKWIKDEIHPQANLAVKIARALNTSVEYLVTGEEPGMPFLNEKEKKLIDASRRMTEDDMERLLTIAESLATLSRGESSRTA